MTKNYTIYWISPDRQSSLDMGHYPSRDAAEAAVATAKAELLGQCGEQEDRDNIEAGTWTIDETA
jgi:hypothetical protein